MSSNNKNDEDNQELTPIGCLIYLLIAVLIVGGGYVLSLFFPGGEPVGILPFPPFNITP